MRIRHFVLPVLLLSAPLASWTSEAGNDSPTEVLAAYFEVLLAAEHVSELIPYLPAELVGFLEARMHTDVEEAAAWLADLQGRAPSNPTFLEEVIHGTEAMVSYNYMVDGQESGGLWVLLLEDGAWKVLPE